MKIVREVNGVSMEFELTELERFKAYEEHEHVGDVDYIWDMFGDDEHFDGMSDIEKESAINEIAYKFRNKLIGWNEPDTYEVACSALEEYFEARSLSLDDKLAEAIERSGGSFDAAVFEKAVEYLAGDMDVFACREYLEVNADKVVYVYENHKDFMDLDFWIRFELLLDEKLTYDEFMAVNSRFDGDPFDVKFEDADTISGFRKDLDEYRDKEKGGMSYGE